MKILDKLGDIEIGSVANMQKLKITYMYVALGIMLATFGLGIGLAIFPQMGGWTFAGLFILEIAVLIYFMFKKDVLSYSLFTFLTGLTLVPVIGSLIGAGLVGIIFQAFIGTLIIVALLTFYTLTTRKNYLAFRDILFYILIGVVVISLINLFLGNSILSLIISIVVMVLFSFFIIVDTQEVLYTDIDPLMAACSLYLNILNMFIALLNILTSLSKD